MSWALSVPFAALLLFERREHLRAREVFEELYSCDVLRRDSGVLYAALASLEASGGGPTRPVSEGERRAANAWLTNAQRRKKKSSPAMASAGAR